MYNMDLEKAEEPEIKLPTSTRHRKKKKKTQMYSIKTSTSTSLTMLKSDYVDHNKLWDILEEMGILDHLTCLLRKLCRTRSNS